MSMILLIVKFLYKYFWEGLSYRSIASKMSLTSSAIVKRKTLAIQKLREEFRAYGVYASPYIGGVSKNSPSPKVHFQSQVKTPTLTSNSKRILSLNKKEEFYFRSLKKGGHTKKNISLRKRDIGQSIHIFLSFIFSLFFPFFTIM